MFKLAIPVLHVESIEIAQAFYCDHLGFEVRFAYRIDENQPDPCYMGLVRDDACIHISSFSGDGISGGVVYLIVENVDDLYQQFQLAGFDVDLEPTDQTWGNREMYLDDPDGNSIRFIQEQTG